MKTDKAEVAVNHLSKIVALLLECERETNSIHLQDYADRSKQRWLYPVEALPEAPTTREKEETDRTSEPAQGLTQDHATIRVSAKAPHNKATAMRAANTFVSLLASHGIAVASFAPSAVAHGDDSYAHLDLLSMQERILHKAHAAFERGPYATDITTSFAGVAPGAQSDSCVAAGKMSAKVSALAHASEQEFAHSGESVISLPPGADGLIKQRQGREGASDASPMRRQLFGAGAPTDDQPSPPRALKRKGSRGQPKVTPPPFFPSGGSMGSVDVSIKWDEASLTMPPLMRNGGDAPGKLGSPPGAAVPTVLRLPAISSTNGARLVAGGPGVCKSGAMTAR